MCWIHYCQNQPKHVSPSNAFFYFYHDEPTINTILQTRYDVYTSVKMLNSLKYGLFKTVEQKILQNGTVFSIVNSTEPQVLNAIKFESFTLQDSHSMLNYTDKECSFAKHIGSLPTNLPSFFTSAFISMTSCNVFHFYFGDAINLNGIGLMNFPFIKAIVDKAKQCDVAIPEIYRNYSDQDVFFACSAKQTELQALGVGFDIATCLESVNIYGTTPLLSILGESSE